MADQEQQQPIKNTKPKVEDYYNEYNGAIIPRDRTGKFTHSQVAEADYQRNYVAGGGNPPAPPATTNSRKRMEQVANDAFLAQTQLPQEIMDCFVKLEDGETFSNIILNNNQLTDRRNKVDGWIEIYDENGETIDTLFIDFKHKNSLMKDSLTSFNGKSFDFCLGKIFSDTDSNGNVSHRYASSSFGNSLEMSQLTVFGVIDSGGDDANTYLNKLQDPSNTPSDKMLLTAVNKVALKDCFLRDLLNEQGQDMDLRLQNEANDMMNKYLDSNFMNQVLTQTQNKSGAFYDAGFEAEDADTLSYKLTEGGEVKLVVKKVGNVRAINVQIDYDTLEKIGIAKTLKGK